MLYIVFNTHWLALSASLSNYFFPACKEHDHNHVLKYNFDIKILEAELVDDNKVE